jgi:hypothetical protein
LKTGSTDLEEQVFFIGESRMSDEVHLEEQIIIIVNKLTKLKHVAVMDLEEQII